MRKVLVVAVCLALTGCGVSFPKPDPDQVSCSDVAVLKMSFPTLDDPPPLYRIAYTDDGEFVNRCEVSKLFRDLRPGGDQIVLLYVHGWKHNNGDHDADLTRFTAVVQTLRDAEAGSTSPRRVVGIYVAWNGSRTTWPVAKQLTFWGRKRAADKVAQSAAVTRLLAAVDSIRRKRESQNRNDLHVYVGHSFGARILYNAVAQTLIRETELAHPGEIGKPYERISGIGDMVILLNPAFEASLFSVFHDVRRREYPFLPDRQPPLIVSISSDTDRATRQAFPLGQTLNFERSPKRRITVGNYKDYWTHRVALRSEANATNDCSDHVCMTLIAKDGLYVPFINARADKAVMNGHGDIWSDNVKEFVAHLIARRIAADKLSASASALPANPSPSPASLIAETNRD